MLHGEDDLFWQGRIKRIFAAAGITTRRIEREEAHPIWQAWLTRERFDLSPDKKTAIDCVNQLAPEHLHVQTRDPDALVEEVESAGAVFLGPFTPVAVGDYAAGTSHVLPTGGTVRWSSGLNANDFRKRTSILRFTRNGLKEMAEDVLYLANAEGLTAHAASVSMRVQDNGPAARPKPKPDKVAAAPATAKK